MNILITGTSGNVGQEIRKHLIKSELQSVFWATRDKNVISAEELFFDFEDLTATSKSIEGIDVVFLLRPPHISEVIIYFKPLIEIFQEKKVKHLIFLSVQGADKIPFIPHAKIEKLILQSGINYTFIRPSYFMQNLSTTLQPRIKNESKIFLPAGKAKFLWIDVADIGKAIAAILANPELHQNKAYTLTGKDLFNFFEVSTLLSEVLGRKITFESPNLLKFFMQMRKEGIATGFILVMIMLHYLPRFQKLPVISIDFEVITNSNPTHLKDFIYRHSDVWK
jgi:uncharacterized protein YbjT (DUF2867 family)